MYQLSDRPYLFCCIWIFSLYLFFNRKQKSVLKCQNFYFWLPVSDYINLNLKQEPLYFFNKTKRKSFYRFSVVWAVILGCLTAMFLPWNQNLSLEISLSYANLNRLWPFQLTSDADNCCTGFSCVWQLCSEL